MRPLLLSSLLLITGIACSRPPDAPIDLETLTGYLFTHMTDEEPEAMEAGIANISTWLDANIEATSEGYAIANLDQESLDALDDTERSAANLDGAAVSTQSAFELQTIAEALIVADQQVVYPDRFDNYDREFVEDVDCFIAHECETLNFNSDLTTNLPLNIKVTNLVNGSLRWVNTEQGPALVGRTWLTGPADVSVDFFKVHAQYYLTVNLPRAEGTDRLHAMWAETEILGVDIPEATALNMLIDSLGAGDEMLYEYLTNLEGGSENP